MPHFGMPHLRCGHAPALRFESHVSSLPAQTEQETEVCKALETHARVGCPASWAEFLSFIPDLASAANILDIPESKHVIVTAVATEISKEAAGVREYWRGKHHFLAVFHRLVTPNGKLSIEYHGDSELAMLVSKLRAVEPELVDDQLTTRLLVQEAVQGEADFAESFAGLYNHLVAKQRMGPTEAAD